jgi:hypothetical protein
MFPAPDVTGHRRDPWLPCVRDFDFDWTGHLCVRSRFDATLINTSGETLTTWPGDA